MSITPIQGSFIPITNPSGTANMALTSFAQAGKVQSTAAMTKFASELAEDSNSEESNKVVEKKLNEQVQGIVPNSLNLFIYEEEERKQKRQPKKNPYEDRDEEQTEEQDAEQNEEQKQEQYFGGNSQNQENNNSNDNQNSTQFSSDLEFYQHEGLEKLDPIDTDSKKIQEESKATAPSIEGTASTLGNLLSVKV